MKMNSHRFPNCILLPVLTVLFAAAPMSAALSEQPRYTVSDLREQCGDGWHQTYEAYGRTIQVDLCVQVPKADAFPILRVTFPGPLTTDILTQEGYHFVNKNEWFAGGVDGGPYFSTAGLRAKSPRTELRLKDLDWDQKYAEDNPMTLREADNFMREKLALLFGDGARMELSRVVLAGRLRSYSEKTGEYGEPLRDRGNYILYYFPVLRGIPLLANAVNTFKTRVNEVPGERLMLANEIQGYIYTESDFNIHFICKKEVGMVMEDSPLCSFDTVKKAYERLIQKGQIRNIYSVRLGYACYQDPKEKDIFWAMPSWVAECEWYSSAKDDKTSFDLAAELTHEISGYRRIIVNAQTGELLDPLNQDDKRSYCPDILSFQGQ